MEISMSSILLLCAHLSCFTIDLVLTDLDDCGNGPPVGNCAHDCYRDCIKGLVGITDPFEKEKVIMTKNLCILHCQGQVYKPQMKFAPKRRPRYSDVSNCLHPCEHPISDYCKDGYLSMFFYCDCHTCCSLKSPANAELCIAGCHEWYGKQWSSLGTELCTFKPEFKKTPILYCRAYCTWRILRNFYLDAIDISAIQASQVIPCTTKCVAILHNDIPMDYHTVVTRCPESKDLYKCVTSVKVVGFNITVALTDIMISSAPTIKEYDDNQKTEKVNNDLDVTVKEPTFGIAHIPVKYKVTKPTGLINMKAQGIAVEVNPGAAANLKLPMGTSRHVTKADISKALMDAFQMNSPSTQGTQKVTVNFNHLLEVDGCTKLEKTPLANLAQVKISYDVFLTVSDSSGIVPMDANRLKKAVAAKTDWREGMSYNYDESKNKDKYSIDMVGTGSILIEIAVSSAVEFSCDLLENCNSPTRNNQNPCRCLSNC